MNYKIILQEIQKRQLEHFYSLDDFISMGTTLLPKYRRGLYWFWSRLDYQLLREAKDNHKSEVPISKLIEQRIGLNSICHIENKNFKVMYNGIGGYKTNPRSYGLRERILQEINSTDIRTGTLNIRNRYENNINWAVSFFDFDDEENKKYFPFLNEPDAYKNYASDLEKLWRLEFGHPILCRH